MFVATTNYFSQIRNIRKVYKKDLGSRQVLRNWAFVQGPKRVRPLADEILLPFH